MPPPTLIRNIALPAGGTAGRTSTVGEPSLSNAGNYAWAYPDTCPNADGIVGTTLFRGGGTIFPSHVVGILDAGTGTWQLAATRNGTHAPNDGKWGDYLTCRRRAPANLEWIASGFTLQGGPTRNDIEPRFVHFRM